MKISAVIGLAFTLVASSALAWNEPDGFRNIKWGTSAAETEKILKKGKGPYEQPTCSGGVLCYESGTIGPLSTTFGYFFSDSGRFERATFQFDPRNYDMLLRIFTERYGAPSVVAQETFRTNAGVTFTNHIARWMGSRVVVELYRYRNRIDYDDAVVALKIALDRMRRETERAIKKGKDDL